MDGAGRARVISRTWLVAGVLLVLAGIGIVGVGLATPSYEAAPIPTAFSVEPQSPAPHPTGSSAASPSPSLPPGTLAIPSLDIQAPLVPGDVSSTWTSGPTLQIPDDPAKLTRYAGGASPCATQGTVLLAGHVAALGRHGALWPLAQIAPHATVYISCEDGTVTTWQAVSVSISPKSQLPQDIFTATGPLRAEIVTCGGPVASSGHYTENVLVTLVPA